MNPNDFDTEAYYSETDPAKRSAMLNSSEDLPGYSLRRKFFLLRHGTDRGGITTDKYLWQCVNLSTFYSNVFFLKRKRSEIIKILREMGFSGDASPEEENALYWELRNALRRYIETTKAPGYRRKVFGLVSAKDSERNAQLCGDMWKISCGLAEKYDLRRELLPLLRAANDEYLAFSPDSESLDKDYRRIFHS